MAVNPLVGLNFGVLAVEEGLGLDLLAMRSSVAGLVLQSLFVWCSIIWATTRSFTRVVKIALVLLYWVLCRRIGSLR